MDYKHKYTMGSTMEYCITVHMKEYSSAGTLRTIPWALLHHGMQRNGWTHSSVQVPWTVLWDVSVPWYT